MKKIRLLLMPLLTLSFSACSLKENSFSSNKSNEPNISSKEETEQQILKVNVDYGMCAKDHATHLLGNCFVPFDLKQFNIDALIAGDIVTITYTGTWQAFSTYPGQIASPDLVIVDVKVDHGTIFEFEVAQNPGVGYSLRPTDGKQPGQYETRYCINEDKTFAQDVLNYPINTKIYGVCPKYYDNNNILAFYSYNPLAVSD